MKSIDKLKTNLKQSQVAGAQKTLIEQLFDDHYRFRWRIYKMNFFRGVFFGLGSVLGATIVVGLVVWLLSIFTDIPLIGNFFHDTQSQIENR